MGGAQVPLYPSRGCRRLLESRLFRLFVRELQFVGGFGDSFGQCSSTAPVHAAPVTPRMCCLVLGFLNFVPDSKIPYIEFPLQDWLQDISPFADPEAEP